MDIGTFLIRKLQFLQFNESVDIAVKLNRFVRTLLYAKNIVYHLKWGSMYQVLVVIQDVNRRDIEDVHRRDMKM